MNVSSAAPLGSEQYWKTPTCWSTRGGEGSCTDMGRIGRLGWLIWDDGGQPTVTYTAPDALAARYGLSPELSARLAGIGPLTDALVAP